MTLAISVKKVGKSFDINPSRESGVDAIAAALSPRNLLRRTKKSNLFVALHDIDIDIERGESVGLVGRNGAGKSTLLKVLARVTPPTTGTIELRGRVGSLLEVGAGFHGELSGRENIFLNGSILGMRAQEIRRSFDEIVEFAGVGEFLETPVKRYSSGMYVRLAFSVAAHLRADILLVDEVLSVGDAVFQEKSLKRMQDLAQQGRTIVLVSHHMPSVQQLCKRTVLLEKGTVYLDGPTSQAVDGYRALQETDREARRERFESNERADCATMVSLEPHAAAFHPSAPKSFDFIINGGPMSPSYSLCFVIRDDKGTAVTMAESRVVGGLFEGPKDYRGTFTLERPWLAHGRYSIDVWFHTVGDVFYGACDFLVTDDSPYPRPVESWVWDLSRALAEFRVDVKEQ